MNCYRIMRLDGEGELATPTSTFVFSPNPIDALIQASELGWDENHIGVKRALIEEYAEAMFENNFYMIQATRSQEYVEKYVGHIIAEGKYDVVTEDGYRYILRKK